LEIDLTWSAAAPEARGYPVDRQVNCFDRAIAFVTASIAPQQLDLHVVERIEIRNSLPKRQPQRGIALEEHLLTGDGEQSVCGILQF
jgi:hypothetical protein